MPAVTVSVVIPTHDRPDLLTRTLRSVLAQRHSAMEVLVVDDGCGPATAAAVEAAADDRPAAWRRDAEGWLLGAARAGAD